MLLFYDSPPFFLSLRRYRTTTFVLLLAGLCFFPWQVFAQRLVLTPSTVTTAEGDSADFTVVLSSEPSADVTVTIVAPEGTGINLDKTDLTFNRSNWDQPQRVMMVIEPDMDMSDDEWTIILIASGEGYQESSIIVMPNFVRIASIGESVDLQAFIYEQDGTSVEDLNLAWVSRDSSVATVNSEGKVTGVGFGRTQVRAKFATASGLANIFVGDAQFPDREFLVSLYESTGGENWINQEGWMTNAPINEWFGVLTDEEGYVTELKLDKNNLEGTIAAELGQLTRLKSLNFNGNQISGPIPPELGNLVQLEQLSLGSNSLEGMIPPELGNLSNLKILSLTWNQLWGPIPPEIGKLVQLEQLLLFSNQLEGMIPPELGNLSNLKKIILNSNLFTGIPHELGNLSQLKVLDFDWNHISGPLPPELGNLAQLETLSIGHNSLRFPIPPELGKLTSLKELLLNANEIPGPIPPELGNLVQLKTLGLRENKISGPIPPELGNLTNLTEALQLNNNQLTGSIPSELGKLTQLEDISLQVNSLTGSIPPEFGNLSQLVYLILNSNSLTGPIPSELGNLSKLQVLRLTENELTGSIPSELGNLTHLIELSLDDNSLTGSIPSELGNLTNLRALFLHDNDELTSLLPRDFLSLNLTTLSLKNTEICVQQDAGVQTWWSSIPNKNGGECTSDLVERLALIVMHHKTNGPSWTNTSGWGRNGSVDTWHGVRVENGRVTQLSLPENNLAGPFPAEVANLTELTVLNLADNVLAGSLPEELSLMSNLIELRVNDNQALEGHLRYDLTNLSNLEIFHFGGTSLCASPAQSFQTWTMGIREFSGSVCSNPAEIQLNIPVAYLVQSIQTPQNSVPLIEGREALLRVFVTGGTAAEPAFYSPQVMATVQGGGKSHQVTMTQSSDRLATSIDESHLNHSFNAVIPGEFMTQGATLVVEADPEGLIPRASDSQDRFEMLLDMIQAPPMDVTVVPVLEESEPDESIFEWTDNISDHSSEVGLFKYAFPFHEFRAKSREPYVTSLDVVSDEGSWGLVLELEALRFLDKAQGYYYGATSSVNGFVRGVARLGGWTSMGKAWDTEFAHEVGHNLNLKHAPCGGALDADPDFPYANGSVGVWGYDFRDGTLVSPAIDSDIMGYCYGEGHGWLSDYFFQKVIDYREDIVAKQIQNVPDTNVLVLWGGVHEGELQIQPPFSTIGPVQLPEADGSYSLEGFVGEEMVFSLSFVPGEDKFGNQYFFYTIPVEQEWDGLLNQIVFTGPEGSIAINTNDVESLTVFRDANAGKVRGMLRNWDGHLPSALSNVEDISIVTTQGLMDSIQELR